MGWPIRLRKGNKCAGAIVLKAVKKVNYLKIQLRLTVEVIGNTNVVNDPY